MTLLTALACPASGTIYLPISSGIHHGFTAASLQSAVDRLPCATNPCRPLLVVRTSAAIAPWWWAGPLAYRPLFQICDSCLFWPLSCHLVSPST
ncbi:hypothetical protein BKA80DRAFT_264837 [Phyllosticta citrichinensis]